MFGDARLAMVLMEELLLVPQLGQLDLALMRKVKREEERVP